MLSQCAIRKPVLSKRALLFNQVDDTRGIQRPETEMIDNYGNGGADFDRCIGRIHSTPFEVEHPPRSDGCCGFSKSFFSETEQHAVVIDVITRGGLAARSADLRIREGLRLLSQQKSLDCRPRRFVQEEHLLPRLPRASNTRHHPPAREAEDEGRAVAGRVHAVVSPGSRFKGGFSSAS